MRSSLEWRHYYEDNARNLLEIPWHLGAELTVEEKSAVAQSLKEFQAGESSEGKHLFHYAQAYAERTGDLEYIPTIKLFISEEQRHARDLGRFLELNHIPLVCTTFPDRVFRRLRHLFGGLEISIAVLITAEIIAEVYYAVLQKATESIILRRLCDQILSDERQHVQFQSEQLAKLRAKRSWIKLKMTMALQRFLYMGTVLVVGLIHRRVIRRGGQSLWQWWRACWRQFNIAFNPIPASQPVPDTRLSSP